jgi:hypothetical protein|tara:strand:- start:533 stop:772 length:240 start_codon:yes stop_codon:yes gene_type:complete
MNKDFFKRPDFDNRLNNATETLRKYLTDKEYELTELKVEELIQWHDITPKGPRNIYPHSDCPTELKNIINGIIEQEFTE